MTLKNLLSRIPLRVSLALLSALLVPGLTRAADLPAPAVSLEWSANPEAEVAGYKVHFGTSSGDYTTVYDAGPVTRIELPPMLLGNRYYVALSAYDSEARESSLSAELVVLAAPPAPPASTSFAAGSAGQGVLQWKHPKSADQADGHFTIQTSPDLVTWTPAGTITTEESVRADEQWLYFSVPFATDQPRMFFRVGAVNPFGKSD